MYLRLHTDIDSVMVAVDFDHVFSLGIDARWMTTQITMKDGTVVRVRETPDEIMEMLAKGHSREGLIESLDRVIKNG